MANIKVRARAVDMLGRQQIAGIPTAIHELFKNAHDAYAERIEVDYFRRTRVLVIRDDGYGMSRDDVENRWLTLGTESRVGANRPDSIEDWTGPHNLPRRSIMGEKGIGRLAIAAIAPITLMLTRAARPDGLHDIVVALVHWGVFEQPGLDISQIIVPINEFPADTLPTRKDVKRLAREVRKNIESLQDELNENEYIRLLEKLEKVESISPEIIDGTLRNFLKKEEKPLSLKDDGGCGTHFIMLPTAPELNDDIDGGTDKDASQLLRHLLGFSNTITGETPIIKAEFRDHHLDEYPEELIGPGNFWLPDEYEKADHHFTGTFDEFGQFTGTVRVFGEEKPFVCNWAEGRGRSTKCGPFTIDFAAFQGIWRESTLTKEDHKIFMEKLYRIGGLYIYRDNIRVLPYGNSDLDFLDIEKRRTFSAQDWFFSYRRLFGYVGISHDQNRKLHEKAGREGFRKNQAYRDFRAVLINFFQRLAFEFFRPDAPQSETYWDKKVAYTQESKLLDKQEKKADNRRKEFKKLLKLFFDSYEGEVFEKQAQDILQLTKDKLLSLSSLTDNSDLAVGVRDLESEIFKLLEALESAISITKPRGLALNKTLEKDWAAYQKTLQKVREKIVAPLKSEISTLIRKTTESRISASQRREAVLGLLESQKDTLLKELSSMRNEAYAASKNMQMTLKSVIREEFSLFREEVETMLLEFTRKSAKDAGNIDDAKEIVEKRIREIHERETSLLDSVKRQMEDFAEAIIVRETVDDRVGALEQKSQRLEEQVDFYSDFAQMGMSVGILQHEFEKAAKGLRSAIRDIKPWADGTPQLKVIYARLRKSFDHIDGYLKVIDPLGRRVLRKKVAISGDEIRVYLMRVFRAELESNGISLNATDDFLSRKVKCHSSAVLGAFVNVVDNAIYWVANGAKGEKIISLDVDTEGFTISNTGAGIEERLRERIFDFGETSKPGGRGMGLAVSRDSMRREGFELELIRSGTNVNPVFRIKTKPKGGEAEKNAR